MNLKLLTIGLFAISCFSTLAKSQQQDSMKGSGMMKMAPAEIMAKPAFEGNSGNFNLKVWVMAVNKDEKTIIKGTKDNESLTGTHNIIVELADAEKSTEIPGAIVKILSFSPSGKKTTTELESMMNQYGGKIDLDEKGEYQLSVSVEADGNATVTPFLYNVN